MRIFCSSITFPHQFIVSFHPLSVYFVSSFYVIIPLIKNQLHFYGWYWLLLKLFLISKNVKDDCGDGSDELDCEENCKFHQRNGGQVNLDFVWEYLEIITLLRLLVLFSVVLFFPLANFVIIHNKNKYFKKKQTLIKNGASFYQTQPRVLSRLRARTSAMGAASTLSSRTANGPLRDPREPTLSFRSVQPLFLKYLININC